MLQAQPENKYIVGWLKLREGMEAEYDRLSLPYIATCRACVRRYSALVSLRQALQNCPPATENPARVKDELSSVADAKPYAMHSTCRLRPPSGSASITT